jgi:hypothetical protein
LKTVKVYGLIKYLEVYLVAYPHIDIKMDVIVIDVPDAWQMLLSRKWAATLGGYLSMDLTHAHIPMRYGTFDDLYHQPFMKIHVQEPSSPDFK